ncbi:hypothetical protein HOF65_02425 [bacterium]|nr:hypothetical protein [bacterium]MBT3852856.1 hypothetical protein [bacterium]MBT4632454.1 hypothetical protein [bacterium]MBT6779558.1 hypothetical protein [bacterium]
MFARYSFSNSFIVSSNSKSYTSHGCIHMLAKTHSYLLAISIALLLVSIFVHIIVIYFHQFSKKVFIILSCSFSLFRYGWQ